MGIIEVIMYVIEWLQENNITMLGITFSFWEIFIYSLFCSIVVSFACRLLWSN